MKYRIGLIKLICFFLTGLLNSQDSIVQISPALFVAPFTYLPYDLATYNPLIIGYLPMNKGPFYGELRYNYDRNGTLGIYGGYTLIHENKAIHLFTPQLGYVTGDYKGPAVQFYYNLIHPKIEFNLTNNYVFTSNNRPNYYFNWSDFQIPVFEKFRVGGTVQIFEDQNLRTIDPGLLLAYRHNNWYLMAATFNFYDPDKHFLFFVIQKTFTIKL